MHPCRRLVPVVAWLAVPLAFAADPDDATPAFEMTTYQFVLFHRAEGAPAMGERTIQRHQEAHLAWESSLLREGTAVAAGPLDGAGDLRSVLVLAVESVEAAEGIVRRAPWVRAGRLRPEIHPWWAGKGILRKPEPGTELTRCWLGLLKRPDGAPDFPEATLREIQEGHMANINAMADSGELVIAGPMGDDGKLRGIFVFRDADPERVREMVARDPAVKMGRLAVELYPWHLPRGTLPPR